MEKLEKVLVIWPIALGRRCWLSLPDKKGKSVDFEGETGLPLSTTKSVAMFHEKEKNMCVRMKERKRCKKGKEKRERKIKEVGKAEFEKCHKLKPLRIAPHVPTPLPSFGMYRPVLMTPFCYLVPN